MDKTAQKAYVERVLGCVEHVMVVQEIIQQAKLHKKTVHITWLDLEEAFGSVPHEIIPYYYVALSHTKMYDSIHHISIYKTLGTSLHPRLGNRLLPISKRCISG